MRSTFWACQRFSEAQSQVSSVHHCQVTLCIHRIYCTVYYYYYPLQTMEWNGHSLNKLGLFLEEDAHSNNFQVSGKISWFQAFTSHRILVAGCLFYTHNVFSWSFEKYLNVWGLIWVEELQNLKSCSFATSVILTSCWFFLLIMVKIKI